MIYLDFPVAPERVHRITRATYATMGRLKGVVLKRGVLVNKMTKSPRHAVTGERISDMLKDLRLSGYCVRHENPIVMDDGLGGFDSEPEPNVVLARGTRADYLQRHPSPHEVVLLIEVAASSLAEDRAFLLDCAWFSIPCVWIVNLQNDTVEVYRQPAGTRTDDAHYAENRVYRRGDTLEIREGGQVLGRLTVDALLADA